MGARTTRVAIAAAALALLAPAGAAASTAKLEVWPTHQELPPGSVPAYRADYIAAGGESNHLVVTLASDRRSVTFHDTGATIHARSSCHASDPHTATCSPTRGGIPHVVAALGDGNDDVHAPGWHDIFATTYGIDERGGPGDDVLVGSALDDVLDGGGGRDTLRGGPGDDTLTDGDRDAAGSQGPDADVLDGGPGSDFLGYADRTKGVTVTAPSDDNAGESGEHDMVRSVENVRGGNGPDHLTGDAQANRLYGDFGDDVLEGRGGDDTLDGGDGADRLGGGDGADSFNPGPGIDSLGCGSDNDVVINPDGPELMPRSCELVRHEFDEATGVLYAGSQPRSVTRRFATFNVGCPDIEPNDEFTPCKMRLVLREASGRHRVLGRGRSQRKTFNDTSASRVRLTRLGRRLVRRHGGVLARLSIHGSDFPPLAWTLRLKR